MTDIAIRVQNLSKCYHIYDAPRDRLKQFVVPRVRRMMGKSPNQYFREFWALKNVSFEIKKGETVGIVGRNGSGKSTLLQMICGTLTPTSGTVKTKGRIAALLELGSGFNREFTGRENVYVNGALLGLSKEEVDERFEAIAAFADIGDFIEQPVKTYSSGMFVRLAFAIQANVDPEILIVDEALAVGDAYFVHRCMLRFHEMQAKGATILFVSHSSASVTQLCDRAIWLDNGSLKMEGKAPAVVDSYLSALFNQPEVKKVIPQVDGGEHLIENATMLGSEKDIPNIDRRIGTQEIVVTGMGIYDSFGRKIATAVHGDTVTLRISFKNVSCAFPDRFVIGYIFKNARGECLASTNSEIEEASIPLTPIGAISTVAVKIELPLLCPGSYSFSPTVAYIDPKEGKPIVTDRVENAILLANFNYQKVPA